MIEHFIRGFALFRQDIRSLPLGVVFVVALLAAFLVFLIVTGAHT